MLLLPRQQIISRHKASRHHDAAIKGKTRGNHRQEKAGELSEQRQESARRSPKRRRARRRGGGRSVDVFADFGTGTEVGGSGRGGRGGGGGGELLSDGVRKKRSERKSLSEEGKKVSGRRRGAGMRCGAERGRSAGRARELRPDCRGRGRACGVAAKIIDRLSEI